jgi:hypothetical protein
MKVILEHRRMMVNEVVKQLNISILWCMTTFQFDKACAWWVSIKLMEKHKHTCFDICSGEEDDNFLQQIITGDDAQVHYYQQEKHAMEASATFCCNKFKLMLTFFWDSQGCNPET